MAEKANFADATFEPSDAQLNELAHEAFAPVRQAHERALAAVQKQIRVERERVLSAYRARVNKARP